MLPQPGEQSDATAEDNQCKGEKHRLSKQTNTQPTTPSPQKKPPIHLKFWRGC